MHQVPISFRHDGFAYTQLARVGDIALFEQRTSPEVCAYEVIRVQWRKARTLPSGAQVEEGEYFPSTSQWGRHGFTFRRRDLAEAKMALLLNQATSKQAAELTVGLRKLLEGKDAFVRAALP